MQREIPAGFEVGEIVFLRREREKDADALCSCEYNECASGDCDCDGDMGCCNADVGEGRAKGVAAPHEVLHGQDCGEREMR